MHPAKRARDGDLLRNPPRTEPYKESSSPSSTSTSFRNVSACNRCRLRKNRCDQNLPACSSCSKANVKCVGYDPITKREIPRAYVYYLESRVTYLESLLFDNGVHFAPAEEFDLGTKPLRDVSLGRSPASERMTTSIAGSTTREESLDGHGSGRRDTLWKLDEADKLNKLVSNVGMVPVQGASDPRFLGSTSGISFARVVFAAVKTSVTSTSSERGSVRQSNAIPAGAAATSGTSMRDTIFGLQSKPTFKQAPFPDKELGLRLVTLYFEHANPQIPILHRGEFMSLFDRVYATVDKRRSPRELYLLNIVFAIGAGIIFGEPDKSPVSARSTSPIKEEPSSPRNKKPRLSSHQHQPEEYHASAIVHLESFLGSMPAADRPDGFGGGLEELQAVLLLASFALLRPVAPGLWYIVGVAVRLGVDLGLHYEDGAGIDDSEDCAGIASSQDVAMGAAGEAAKVRSKGIDAKERGRREWIRDLRRRLWWCVYSFDRLVSTCVGRPVGITDQVITTEFPSVLDDKYITTSGFVAPPSAFDEPSYKRAAHHYFRLRLLQSEILQVLQYRQAQQARANARNRSNEHMHITLPSPFLQGFESFRAWRKDIDRRLWEWKESAPRQEDIAVQFSVQFLELNYWQAVIMLYRQSLSVPPLLAGEASPTDDLTSPLSMNTDEQEDDDEVFLKVAEAGQKTLKLYRQLHRIHLVNYTFLATHHLFMAGIAFLFAIWHSATVRRNLTLDDVDFTVLAATSVLGDLMEKCPPAESCRDAFDRMSKATVQMCLATTGFGSKPSNQIHGPINRAPPVLSNRGLQYGTNTQAEHSYSLSRRPPPQFDMNLRDLFPEETQETRSFARNLNRWQAQLPLQAHSQSSVPFQDAPFEPAFQQAAPSTPLNFGDAYDAPMFNTTTNNGSYDNHDIFDDVDLQLADNNGTFNGNSGLHLGFDSEHDWSDGTGLDLFDGFFFGGGGSGSLL